MPAFYVRCVSIVFCLLTSLNAVSQSQIFTGQIIDQSTAEPLPQAAIWNLSKGNGTVSNNEGFFQLPAQIGDSILIRYVGYKSKSIVFNDNAPNLLGLEAKNELLTTVSVRPKSTAHLYELVAHCRKAATKQLQVHKAYYETSTYLNGQQLELVEGFYNAHYTGYGLDSLIMCMGRVGWRAHDGQYFFNLETSKSYVQLNPIHSSKFFPTSPLQLSERNAKKRFILWELNRFYDADYQDTVVSIQFTRAILQVVHISKDNYPF